MLSVFAPLFDAIMFVCIISCHFIMSSGCLGKFMSRHPAFTLSRIFPREIVSICIKILFAF